MTNAESSVIAPKGQFPEFKVEFNINFLSRWCYPKNKKKKKKTKENENAELGIFAQKLI